MNEELSYNPETDEQRSWQLIQKLAREILVSKKEQLTDWRQLDEGGRQARQLRKIVEIASGAKKAIEEHPEQAEQIKKQIVSQLKLERTSEGDERIRQFQARFIQEVFDLPKTSAKPEVGRFVETLKKAASTEGEVNCFDLLSSPTVDLSLKKVWLESQILPRLNFLARRDLVDAQKPPPIELKAPNNLPPKDEEEMRPSIDETEKQEGEPHGFFTAEPFYGGYWKEKTFENWNPASLTFTRLAKQRAEIKNVEVNLDSRRVLQGKIGLGRTSLPLPYNFAYLPKTIKLAGGQVNMSEDEDGNGFLENLSDSSITFSLNLAKRVAEITQNPPPAGQEISTGRLSQETEKFLADLQNDSSLSLLDKARGLKQYVRRLLEYPGEGDSKYNQIYYQNPSEFFRKIEQHKKADCDVANTFYIALLSRLGITARLAVGHYIKIKDNQGRAVFSSGTGHAWAEVWDNGWHRLDATPSGDPNMDQEETDELSDEDFEGDFGEIEAEVLSDEELEGLIEEVKKLREERDIQKLPSQEQTALHFAQEAGCSPEEAKRILAELAAARELKDSRGRRILDLLSAEFGKIIRQNFREVPGYRAPVRISEGDELENPVEAWIDIKAGETDPTGFKKFAKKIERFQVYGGFDCILVADKSGSMVETDSQTGKPKWQEQQRFLFLAAEGLHRFALLARQNQIRMLNKIDVRTSLITFRAGGAKPVLALSENWGPKEQLVLWRALQENIGGGTPDHLGLAAARQLIEEDTAQSKIKENVNVVEAVGLTNAAKEVEATYYPNGKCLETVSEAPEWAAQRIIANVQRLYPQKVKGPKARNVEKKRLRLIIVTADGGSDNKAAVQQELVNLRSE